MKIAVCLALLVASTVATSLSESGTPVAHNRKLAFAPGYTGGLCKDMLCPEKKAPVCGSDGVRMITYPNECELHMDACNNPDNSNITLLANEPCPLPIPQSAGRKLMCSSDHTGPCNDVLCPEEDAPVCGSDGVTYPNACELGLAANNYPERNIKLLSNEPCPLPIPQSAGRKLMCAPDHKGPCNDMLCPEEDAPVCGSDGVTYPNACELGLAANNYPERNIKLLSNKPCPLPVPQSAGRKLMCSSDHTGPCNDVLCPEEDAPVCGSDGVTYPNPCELGLAANNYPELNITQVSSTPCACSNQK